MGSTTTTDTRAKRNRASRKGGHLLTRARGSSCKSGLPTLNAPRRPCPGWAHHTPINDRPGTVSAGYIMPVTNAIESLNSVIRKAIKNRKIFPTDQSAMKVVYLAIEAAAKKWSMPIRNWKAALNRFMIEFPDRMPETL